MVEPSSLVAISMPPWYVSFCFHLLSGWWWSNLWWDICKAIVVCSTAQRELYICLAVLLALFLQELLLETEPLSGMLESLFICCCLLNAFSQEAIGEILRAEFLANNRRKGQEVKGTERV